MTLRTREKIDAILEAAIIGEPRSQQQAIGPSEIGAACLHCLAAKLAGWEQAPEAAWLPYLGTAVHAYLEKVFEPLAGWHTERRVSVGTLGGKEITGTSDLFDVEEGCVVDWKLVGQTTLRKAKGGPSPVYKAQAHLYGMGYVRAGFDVRDVAIYYLPRNAISLRHGVWWDEPFNPLLALDALDRATNLLAKLEAFPTIEQRDAYITSLPRDAECWDCARFHDAPKKAPADSLDAALGL